MSAPRFRVVAPGAAAFATALASELEGAPVTDCVVYVCGDHDAAVLGDLDELDADEWDRRGEHVLRDALAGLQDAFRTLSTPADASCSSRRRPGSPAHRHWCRS